MEAVIPGKDRTGERRGDTTSAACAEWLDGRVTTVIAAIARARARPGQG